MFVSPMSILKGTWRSRVQRIMLAGELSFMENMKMGSRDTVISNMF